MYFSSVHYEVPLGAKTLLDVGRLTAFHTKPVIGFDHLRKLTLDIADLDLVAKKLPTLCPKLHSLHVQMPTWQAERINGERVDLIPYYNAWTIEGLQGSEWFARMRPLRGLTRATFVVDDDYDSLRGRSDEERQMLRDNIALMEFVFARSVLRSRKLTAEEVEAEAARQAAAEPDLFERLRLGSEAERSTTVEEVETDAGSQAAAEPDLFGCLGFGSEAERSTTAGTADATNEQTHSTIAETADPSSEQTNSLPNPSKGRPQKQRVHLQQARQKLRKLAAHLFGRRGKHSLSGLTKDGARDRTLWKEIGQPNAATSP